jgi:cytochrome c peroxidase
MRAQHCRSTLIVDARTLTPVAALSNPAADTVTATLRQTLAQLDGQPMPSPVAPVTYDDRFTRDQWDMIHDMQLVQPPTPDPTNRVADDPDAAALGLTLFETGKLSPQQVGCRSCHNPALLLTDGKEVPPEGTSVRHAQRSQHRSRRLPTGASWAGVADSLWMLSVLPVELDFEYGSTRLFAAHAIFTNYKAEYEDIFGPMPAPRRHHPLSRHRHAGNVGVGKHDTRGSGCRHARLVNMGKSIAAYLRSLRVAPSALDAYASGQLDALTSKQKDGLLAFFSAGCAQCHYGPRLSNDSFHNLRFPSGKPDHSADTGRSDGIPFYIASEFRRTGKYSDAPTIDASH